MKAAEARSHSHSYFKSFEGETNRVILHWVQHMGKDESETPIPGIL
jgi:hypothetical protein